MKLKCYTIPGKKPDVALIIAGIHGSELSGIEVAHWLRVKLEKKTAASKGTWKPFYTTIIIPEVYPGSAKLARECLGKKPSKKCVLSQQGREVLWEWRKKEYVIPPNRQYPPPGKSSSAIQNGPTDPDGKNIKVSEVHAKNAGAPQSLKVPLLPETMALLQFIEKVKPKRLASIHAKIKVDHPDYGIDAPGIFVDPRYDYDKTICQRNPLWHPLLSIRSSSKDCIVSEKKRIEFGTTQRKFDLEKEPATPVVGLIMQLYEWIDSSALNWDAIPGKESLTFNEFLKKRYGVNWVDNAVIAKIDQNKTIQVSLGNNHISLKLDLPYSMAKLETNNGIAENVIVTMIDGRRKIYPLSDVELSQIKDAVQYFKKKNFKDSLKLAQQAAVTLENLGFKIADKSTFSAITPDGKKDDRLTWEIAKQIYKKYRGLVPGNHLEGGSTQGNKAGVVRYPASSDPPKGFSLGDWGPVPVRKSKDSGNREGFPVITVEVYGYQESGSFQADGTQLMDEACKKPLDPKVKPKKFNRTRCEQLQRYAEALMEIFLADPSKII